MLVMAQRRENQFRIHGKGLALSGTEQEMNYQLNFQLWLLDDAVITPVNYGTSNNRKKLTGLAKGRKPNYLCSDSCAWTVSLRVHLCIDFSKKVRYIDGINANYGAE